MSCASAPGRTWGLPRTSALCGFPPVSLCGPTAWGGRCPTCPTLVRSSALPGDQDALGLSRIYVQAKCYDPRGTVSRPDVQGFAGALQGAQASQGVFITTASFSARAREYAERVASRIVLIDGARLASLMIRYGVGVQVRDTIRIVEVDEGFFE